MVLWLLTNYTLERKVLPLLAGVCVCRVGEVLEGHVCGLLNGCWTNPFLTVESMCFAFTATCILDLEDEEKLP